VIELFGEHISYAEATRHIAKHLDMEGLRYIQFSEADAVSSMMNAMGLSKSVAESFVELSSALSAGKIRPATLLGTQPNCPTRFADFVVESFAPAYKAVA
jgi:hypothetical protein